MNPIDPQNLYLKKKIVSELIRIDTFRTTEVNSALNKLGILVDYLIDLDNVEGLKKAISLAKTINIEGSSHNQSIYYYYIANALTGIKEITKNNTKQQFSWEEPYLDEIIINFRKAKLYFSSELLKDVKVRILINLGNELDRIGRFVEAIEIWNSAIDIDPHYSMGYFNKAMGLKQYSGYLFDEGHKIVYLYYVNNLLIKSISFDNFDTSLIKKHAEIELKRFCNSFKEFNKADIESKLFQPYQLGDTNDEINYRQWCLSQNLFLNPLNDLGEFSIAAKDILSLPNIVLELKDFPEELFYFNLIKQEYCSARYMFYEGSTRKEAHFSDREVALYIPLDYQAYSYNLELIKNAYRVFYSILDKIAYFLNLYFNLKVFEKDISFRSIWFEKEGFKDIFKESKNLPLRGLYWISKDLYSNDDNFKTVLEPEAQELRDIRNHIEHKYLKIKRLDVKDYYPYDKRKDFNFKEILRDDLINKTFKLMKLVRTSIMHLSFSVYVNESNKANKGKSLKTTLPLVEDSTKD